MCGIAGELRFDGQPVSQDRFLRMADRLRYRGPDGCGVWLSGNVGFAHRRLAIVDLSEAGRQPMISADGNLIITFNGEIYNYKALRKELEAQGVTFVSSSDTEVLLYLYARDGVEMLHKLRGMFAFTLWDGRTKHLFFARDRMGKKPFFYLHDAQHFIFASEIKAFFPEEKREIDWSALRTFFGLQYIPSPDTGFVGIRSLLPGHAGVVENGNLSLWEYEPIADEPKSNLSFEAAARELRVRFEEAVRLRMIADVPIGALLSGGVDSSAIVACMARESSAPIKTFTMGFPEMAFDERKEAETFARSLGCEHHAFEAKSENLVELLDTLVNLYDVPYADSSSLPTWLLARATRAHVKAVMTGDGGDELFAGYRRYRAWHQMLTIKKYHLDRVTNCCDKFAHRATKDPRYLRFIRASHGLSRSFAEGYARLFSGSYFTLKDEEALLQQEFFAQTQWRSGQQYIVDRYPTVRGEEGAMVFDRMSYLPDDLNVKMDRASMAHGLETRTPFLDQEFVRFVRQLPYAHLYRRGKQKMVLREAVRDLVPSEILKRRKRGFQVPLSAWFRQSARSLFVERCLVSNSTLHGIVRPEMMRQLLAENDRGIDHGNRLWMLLSLSTWLHKNV